MSFFLVGLSGPSCSGKSSMADILDQSGFGLRVRLDGYYLGLEGAHKIDDETFDWEDIRSFDAEGAARAIEHLKNGEIATIKKYDRKFHRPSGTEEVDPTVGVWRCIVVDSLFCLEDPLFPLFDEVIHLHIDEDLLLRRRRERQGRGPDGQYLYADDYHARCMRPSIERMTRKALERGVNPIDATKLNQMDVIVQVYDRIKDAMR